MQHQPCHRRTVMAATNIDTRKMQRPPCRDSCRREAEPTPSRTPAPPLNRASPSAVGPRHGSHPGCVRHHHSIGGRSSRVPPVAHAIVTAATGATAAPRRAQPRRALGMAGPMVEGTEPSKHEEDPAPGSWDRPPPPWIGQPRKKGRGGGKERKEEGGGLPPPSLRPPDFWAARAAARRGSRVWGWRCSGERVLLEPPLRGATRGLGS